ncbi:GspE/PulE family protein [Maricaulis sp.]|uniref:GspE/PulE family protein n=1 Tax=Maricaulis sp. TaxID=1486257 RepID=UPI00262AE910|nr:GspE/PulE family protein [Maricaulis sp.]
MSTIRDRLDQLQSQGRLSTADAAHALELAERTGEPVDQIISQLGLMSEAMLAESFAAAAGLTLATDADLQAQTGDADWQAQLNAEFLRRERILPLGETNGRVTAAIVDPAHQTAIDGLGFALGKEIRPMVVTISQFNTAFEDRFGQVTNEDGMDAVDVSADAERLRDLAGAAPTVRLVNVLITAAVKARASDIHIEPGARDAGVRFRVDGVLRDERSLPAAQALALISRIKVLADLDIAERRRAQDGRLSLPVEGRSIDLRVSVVPGQFGEGVVIRLLDPDASLHELAELGFSDQVTSVARRALSKPHGLILVTGPTGSGKTTSLYAFLRRLADGERKILTIEDPIEYRLAGIAQSQTNPAIGVTFASALRSFLRHDPDVVMVGEIRDRETAQTAVQAAMTGHLVLSTLHTNDAPSAILRLIDMGVEDYLLASTLVGVIGQRLVRRTCQTCQGTGCEACEGSGYKGRLALAEAFEVDDELRAAIRGARFEHEFKPALEAQGFVSMAEDAETKLKASLTSSEEVRRAIGLGGA